MEESFLSKIQIRPMRMEDLDAIIEIDWKIFEKARPDYWRKIIVPNSQYPFSSLVAEFDGKVVGFIVGEISGGEFGIPDTVGWLTTIGVDPEYQHRGVARELSKTFIQNLKSIGVSMVYTLVNWNDWDLLSFFRKMGFTRGGEMINLQLKIG